MSRKSQANYSPSRKRQRLEEVDITHGEALAHRRSKTHDLYLQEAACQSQEKNLPTQVVSKDAGDCAVCFTVSQREIIQPGPRDR